MNSGLNNKRVLITGASSGIGRATALTLAGQGCHIILSGRNETNLNEAVEECGKVVKEKSQIIEGITADLAEVEPCLNLVEKATEKLGGLDVLVNSAGILVTGSLLDTSVSEYELCMNLNVRSAFLLTKAALPHLMRSKGNVVHVSSVTGQRVFPGVMVYCVSKAALDQLVRAAALEQAQHGVRVNAVNPGVVQTNIHQRAGMDDEQYEAFLEHCKTTHPLGRVGRAEEVAALIAFLADNQVSGFITGQTISIDGGRVLTCLR